MKQLFQHMQHNGFWSTWSQLVESLDPFGEKNALKSLGLGKGASQEEIKARYRELTKLNHPDKVKGTPEEKEAATKEASSRRKSLEVASQTETRLRAKVEVSAMATY